MHVVGAAQLDRASKRVTEGRAFDDDDRHDQSDEREPGERGKHEAEGKEGKRNEGQRAGEPGSAECPAGRPWTLRDENRGCDERDRQERSRDYDLEDDGIRTAEADRHGVDDADRDAERERTPKVARVEADRLRNELAHSARLGRQGRRSRLSFAAAPAGTLLSACHQPEPTLSGTRATRVPTTPAHRQASAGNVTHVKRDRHESAQGASVRLMALEPEKADNE